MDPVIDGFQVGEDTRSLRRGIFEGAGWEMPRVRTTRLVEIRRSRAYAPPPPPTRAALWKLGRNARAKGSRKRT